MKVKKYIAPSMPEALDKVRAEFGTDAVILSSKVVYTGGFLGMFKKRNIEVVAAVEPQPQPVKPVKPRYDTPIIEKELTKQVSPQPDKQQQIVLEELRSIRKWMEQASEQTDHQFPAAFQSVKDHLINQEVDEDVVDEIILANLEQEQELTYHEALQKTKNYLESLFSKYQCGNVQFKQKFIHLVGPTGVGKTTTIAKLAAKSMIQDGKRVALITTDTYRIAAIEQLKTYSNILDIPLEIAYTMEDYQKARLKFQEYDLVFVDTAGRNFRDPKYVAELGKIVDLEHDIETYLVLSATTKAKDLMMLFDQFKAIPLSKLIITKTDETSTYGALLNLIKKNGIGIAYLTHGQNVPDDIRLATPSLLAKLLTESDDQDVS